MSLWNPYAFSVTGQAMTPPSPPALRVLEGQATAQQLAMAQHAFAQFCTHTRLSAVPNPTEQGRLPDGTPYRIVVVGPQATMEIRPVSDGSWKPGIGVASATGYWVLRPPGGALTPASGAWKAESVDAISGGAVYVFARDNYFVEAPSGVSRGNKKLTESIFGATESRYVWASNAFDVSNLFLAGGAAMQLKIEGDSLNLGRRAIAGGGLSDALTTSIHALPDVPDGDEWGMVSTSATGGEIVVCRLENDPDVPDGGQIYSRVRAAARLAYALPSRTVDIGPTQTFSLGVSQRTPNSSAGEAPTKSQWSTSETRGTSTYTVTLPNPNPAAPNPTFDVTGYRDLDISAYEEIARFESTATYRAYIGSAGLLVTDELRRLDKATVSNSSDSSYRGYDLDTWADYTISGNRRAHAAVERTEEVLFGGTQAVKLYFAKIDYDYVYDGDATASSRFSSYRYNSAGEISGFYFTEAASVAALATSSGRIERSSEVVLVADDQFGVVVTVRVGVEATRSARSGHARVTGDLALSIVKGGGSFPGPPINELSSSSKAAASLEILHGAARTSLVLGFPEWVEDQVADVTALLFNEISLRAAPNDPENPGATEGVRDNRFSGERELTEIIDAVFSEQLSDVMYAKDPKTGAGLLSFGWGGKRNNYVVGPWGVASSASRTNFAQDASINALQSV